MSPPILVDALLRHADEEPEHLAILERSREFDYGSMARRIRGTAAFLRESGVADGDRVLLAGKNTSAFVIAYFGIHAARAVAVPIGSEATQETRRDIARWTEARLALQDGSEGDLSCPSVDLSVATSQQERPLPCSLPNADAIADLVFTTGTTGRKKGVALSHRNISSAARNICEFIGTRPDDLEALPLPLNHSFGLGRLRCLALVGHTLMLERGLMNPARILARMVDLGATGLALVPAGVELVRRVPGAGLGALADQLRYLEIGSASIDPATREWLMATLPNTRLCHHYGLTEASRSCFLEYHADVRKLQTVGRPTPNVSVSIVDSDGQLVPVGDQGEIVVRGDMVTEGYWREPDLTRETITPLGLRTGDMGALDHEGYVRLVGRKSDLIDVGGRSVAPDEIEHVLCAHPQVEDAGCVAIPDPQGVLGQCVRAFVVCASSTSDDDLAEWLRPRLEDYKQPREFVRVETLPRTSSGKLQRSILRHGS